MKVKVVHRDPDEYDAGLKKSQKARQVFRNPDPVLHPLEKAREMQRALVATKMEKIFSKPLMGILDGHRDSVRVVARCHTQLTSIFTGSCDGEIRHWDIAKKICVKSIRAHEGFVRGLVANQTDTSLLSCGDDSIVRMWRIESLMNNLDMEQDSGNLVELSEVDVGALEKRITPVQLWTASGPLTSVDHHYTEPTFVSTGETVDIWDINRSTPVHSFDWSQSSDVVFTARFNPADRSLLAASGGDNSIGLFDLRSSSALHRVTLKLRTNALCWNPMKPLNFVSANDDHNLYSFDMRKLDHALVVHKDFTNAVLDVDVSPAGTEFVAGSYDRTVRIFPIDKGRSRDIYHAKRMQIVLACRYSTDSRYVMSGSADFCVRIWKSKAWEAMGPKTVREKKALAYREALKNRYKNVPEIRRILSHHHVPRHVRKSAETKRIGTDADARKELNRELHSKTMQHIPEKERIIKKS